MERAQSSRERLLVAAAELISASPGQDVPLRAICDAAGVKLPTLYHFFGSKHGLLEAVVGYGFDAYLDVKSRHESTGDPIEDLRSGWDAHVTFGLEHPGFYSLMYGRIVPGYRPRAAERPFTLLLGLTSLAAEQERLAVSPREAADHILAANIGVTLYLIAQPRPDLTLSAALRGATMTAITTGPRSEPAT